MATQYFGYCDPSTGAGIGATTEYAGQNELNWRDSGSGVVGTDTCPGTGSMSIITMGCETGYTNFNVGMGLYDYDGNLIVYTTSFKQGIEGDWVSWNNSELTWVVGTTLTGGTDYHIAFITDAASSFLGGVNASYYCQRTAAGNATFPADLPTGTQGQEYFNVRVGVDTAGGGGSTSKLKQLMAAYRRRRA